MNEPYLTIQEVTARWKISANRSPDDCTGRGVPPIHIGRAVQIERSEMNVLKAAGVRPIATCSTPRNPA